MKPIDQIKNEIAHKNNFETWTGVLKAFDQGKLTYGELNDIVNQAMHRLGEIVAIKQRDYDADHADLHDDSNCYREGGYCTNTRVDNDAIRRHPLVSDKYKPQ